MVALYVVCCIINLDRIAASTRFIGLHAGPQHTHTNKITINYNNKQNRNYNNKDKITKTKLTKIN